MRKGAKVVGILALVLGGTFLSCALAIGYFYNLWHEAPYPYGTRLELIFAALRTALIATLGSSWSLWLALGSKRSYAKTLVLNGIAIQVSLTLYAIGGPLTEGDSSLAQFLLPATFFAEYNWLTFIFEVGPVTAIAASLLLWLALLRSPLPVVKKPTRTFGLAVCAVATVAFFASIGLKAESPHYVFVLPDRYTGWIQVIFESPGAPKIEPDHGRFVLRVDKSGVVKTSSTESYVVGGSHDEFVYGREDVKDKEVLSAVPANYYCGEKSGIDSCYGADGTTTDGLTVGRRTRGAPTMALPATHGSCLLGPPELRAKMAKPIHRARGKSMLRSTCRR